MGTTADKLNKIIDSKELIRQSINNKGVVVTTGDTLDSYPSKIDAIKEYNNWKPQPDWIQLEAPANNEILLLAMDKFPYYAFRIVCVGGYIIDWGDGVVENFASNTIASHFYTEGTGQYCLRGYTTFKIRIYSQGSNNITFFSVSNQPFPERVGGLLWVKFGTTGLTSLANAFCISTAANENYPWFLECVELPDSLSNCTNYSYTFAHCRNIEKVKMPTTYSSSDINFSYCFQFCEKLQYVDFNINELNISNFGVAFSCCSSLITVKLPKIVNNCTSFSTMFFSCTSLLKIDLPDINTNCNCGQMFFGVHALRELIFPDSWNGRITYYYGLIVSDMLEKLVFPLSVYTTSFPNIIINCYKLKEFRFPDVVTGSWDTTAVDYGTCQNCISLETVTNFPAFRKSYNGTGLHIKSCNKLKNIDNLNEIGVLNTVPTILDFNGDYSLSIPLAPKAALGRFTLAGISTVNRAALSSLVFANPTQTSTWAGTSPQIDVAYTSMNATALNALFTSIINTTDPTVTGKVIRITGAIGANDCDTTILTAGGKWTVNKTT